MSTSEKPAAGHCCWGDWYPATGQAPPRHGAQAAVEEAERGRCMGRKGQVYGQKGAGVWAERGRCMGFQQPLHAFC
jgi:hypothetical protein